MAIEPDRIGTDDTLPATADVVVIGGGIIGCSTAFFLARQGLSVVLLEKGIVAGEQSGQNWGWCRSQNRNPAELPLMMRSMELWSQMQHMTGHDAGFRRNGALHVASDAAGLAPLRDWLAKPGAAETGARMIGAQEVAAMLPESSAPFAGALWTEDDGRAEPQQAAVAFAQGARAAGARIVQGCAVTELRSDGSGAIRGVDSEQGTVVAPRVVMAGGHWSSLLLRRHGIHLPQLRLLSSVTRTAPVNDPLPMNVAGPGFGLRSRLDGGYTISAGLTVIADAVPDGLRFLRAYLPVLRDREAYGVRMRLGRRFIEELGYGLRGPRELTRTRRLEPAPAIAHLETIQSSVRKFFPWLVDVPVVERWAGYFDVTPDALPVISPVEGWKGLTLSTGYSGHGFGLGPAAGEMTADLVIARTPRVDATPFRLDRFQ